LANDVKNLSFYRQMLFCDDKQLRLLSDAFPCNSFINLISVLNF